MITLIFTNVRLRLRRPDKSDPGSLQPLSDRLIVMIEVVVLVEVGCGPLEQLLLGLVLIHMGTPGDDSITDEFEHFLALSTSEHESILWRPLTG